jgi:hypothetical protein
MRKARSSAAVAGVIALVLAGRPGTAQADRPIIRENTTGHASSDFELCGLAVHGEETFSGPFSIRPAPGSDEAFLVHDSYRYTNVFMLDGEDPSTDEFARVKAHVNFREQQATLLDPSDPNIYQFTAVEASYFRVYGTDGNLLNRDSESRESFRAWARDCCAASRGTYGRSLVAPTSNRPSLPFLLEEKTTERFRRLTPTMWQR